MKKIAASDSRQSVGLKWKTRKGLENLIDFEGNKTKVGGDLEADGSVTSSRSNIGVYDIDIFRGASSNFLGYGLFKAGEGYAVGLYEDDKDAGFALFYGLITDEERYVSFVAGDVDFSTGGMSEDSISYFLNDLLSDIDASYSKARFIHHITATTSAGAYKFSYRSNSNVNCGSVSDLRTVMHISASGDEEAIACCKSDWTATGCFHITTSICQVGSANVTAVSDKVVAE